MFKKIIVLIPRNFYWYASGYFCYYKGANMDSGQIAHVTKTTVKEDSFIHENQPLSCSGYTELNICSQIQANWYFGSNSGHIRLSY